MKLTSDKVKNYMTWRTDEELRHCPETIANVCNDVASEFNSEFDKDLNPKDLLRLLFFNDPIHRLHTHSYGFNTATGRNIILTLKAKYYEYKKSS